MEATKICSKCGKEKPLSEFAPNASRQDGLQTYCKICTREYTTEWNKKNKDKKRKYYINYYAKSRDRNLRYNYGITLSDYDEMFEAQDGGCAICGKTQEEDGKRLSVDHNHETGQVRGLLCNRCNRCLGSFKDNPYLLRSAANYVERFK